MSQEGRALARRRAGPGRSQRRNRPRPLAALAFGRLQTTSPREMVISGQAESSMPSYGV